MNHVRCRRSVNTMSRGDVQHFVAAVTEMKQTGVYDEFVRIHALAFDEGHDGPAFMPWHRKFMLTFEEALRDHDPEVSDPADSTLALPYWDWETPSATMWNDDYMGGTGTPTPFSTGPWASDPPLRGTFDTNGALGSNGISTALSEDRYWTDPVAGPGFRELFEWGPHADAHGWIGGDNAFVNTAAEDPIFFMLHANVERYYVRWQAERRREWLEANPGQAYGQEQLEVDYHWGYDDGTGSVETWSGAPHNLDDAMWPWDGTDPFIGSEVVYVRDMLDDRDLPCVYDTEAPWVTLEHPAVGPPALTFPSVPQGDTQAMPATFAVKSCGPSAQLVVESVTGGFTAPQTTVTVTPPGDDAVTERRVWFQFMGQTPNTTATGEATVYCPETGQRWTISLSATSVRRPTVGTVLALDQSGSMTANAGGRTRGAVLQDAATKFVDLVRPDDGIGVVTFDTNATVPAGLDDAGDGSVGTGADTARTAITNYAPVDPPTFVAEGTDDTVPGYTSIGDGVVAAQGEFPASYEEQAIVVFTDGHENRPVYLEDLDETVLDGRVFAVGLGSASEVDQGPLEDLTGGGTGDDRGYVLTTGPFDDDDYFLLDKYFLQVFAGVTNAQVVVDPEGFLRLPESSRERQRARLPFDLTTADIGADVMMLTPAPEALSLSVETPAGDEIDVETAEQTPGIEYIEGDTMGYYRLSLPTTPADGTEAHAGEWYATVELDPDGVDEYRERLEARADEFEEVGDEEGFERVRQQLRDIDAVGIRYDIAVQTRSDLRLDAAVAQEHYEPGAELTVRARLTETGIPLSRNVNARVQLVDPDGVERTLRLRKTTSDSYKASLTAETAGVYRMRLLVDGKTLHGERFEREHLLSASVSPGGNTPRTHPTHEANADRLSDVLLCLLREGGLDEFFEENEIDPEAVEECLERTNTHR